jgi:hypothetical protein
VVLFAIRRLKLITRPADNQKYQSMPHFLRTAGWPGTGKMKPKLLIFMAWIFFIAARRTADDLWYFCMAYSAVMAVCAFFYRKEKSPKKAETSSS